MRILMISLDKKILDANSAVAQRMIEYGKENELSIIIPSKENKSFDLSQNVHVQSTGGENKVTQFLNLKKIGKNLIKKNNVQEITAQDPFWTGLIGLCLKKKLKIKLEVQMHGDFFSNYYKKQWFRLCLAKFVLKRADMIRVVGERIKQSLIKFGAAESKIQVRPIFVNVEEIKNYQPKFNLHQKYPGYEKIFLVLGRLDSVKNIGWLLNVFMQIVKQKICLLLIVGDGKEDQNLKLQVTSYKLQNNVKFENWTTDPITYLKTADCVLFPSLSEGYGLVPMEAYAAGTPIIMNDVGVANYELKPSEKAESRTVPLKSGSGAWVKILPINDEDAWIKAITSI